MRPYCAPFNHFQASLPWSNPTTKHENNSLTLGGENPPLLSELRTPNSELPIFKLVPYKKISHLPMKISRVWHT